MTNTLCLKITILIIQYRKSPKMPPKQKPNKAEEKKKQEALKDRTFGLKNKKLRAQLEKNIMGGPSKQFPQSKKKNEDEDLKDMSKIFKPVTLSANAQKIGADVDPKSILCIFFKQGLCTKGNKCKFSHDLSTQQKTAKKNLYVDSRELDKEETNENWDERTLQDVAEKKHGEKDRKRPNQTDIVCKYFLDAVENSKYGWFWECPNGESCIYRHALPPGHILKKDKKRMEEQNRLSKISLEEFIETERSKILDKELTKVTLETFIAWKKKKMHEKRQQQMQNEKSKLATFKSGKQTGLSGKDLFTFNPDLIAESNENKLEDGEGADDNVAQYEREPSEDGETDQMHAFEIDDRTFQAVDEQGLLIELDERELLEGGEQQQQRLVVFNQELFDQSAEELPSSSDEGEDDDDNDEANGDGPGTSGGRKVDEEALCKKLNKV